MPRQILDMAPSRPDRLTEAVLDALLDLSDAVQRHYQTRAAEFTLTSVQAQALHHLEPGQPMLMRELAARLDCSAPRVLAIVDGLEEVGLVRRKAPADNRRAFQLILTADGERVRRHVWRRLLDSVPATAGLSDDEQRQLGELLSKALRAHRAAAASP
jgi:MarR family transcriptional regulator, organic hydroperoxide resistance regulator